MFEFNTHLSFGFLISFQPFNAALILPWLFILQLSKPEMTGSSMVSCSGLGFYFFDRFLYIKFFSFEHYFDFQAWGEKFLYGEESVKEIVDPAEKVFIYELVSTRGNSWLVQSGYRLIQHGRLKADVRYPIWILFLTENKTDLPYDKLTCCIEDSPAELVERSESFSEALKKEVEKL